MFFISDAFADAGSAQSGGIVAFLPMIAFIVILYFLLTRPQQKRQKQHQELIASIKKGDKVVTSSGIIATVSKVVNDHEVMLEIANGVHCRFVKSAISSTMDASEKLITAAKNDTPVISTKEKDTATIVKGSAKPARKIATKKVVSKEVAPKK